MQKSYYKDVKKMYEDALIEAAVIKYTTGFWNLVPQWIRFILIDRYISKRYLEIRKFQDSWEW